MREVTVFLQCLLFMLILVKSHAFLAPCLSSFIVAQMVKASAYNEEDPGSIPGLGRSPGEEMQPIPVLLPGKSHGGRSLVGYSP